MEPLPRIEVDWNNAEKPGSLINLYLNCSIEDFKEQGLTPHEGLKIRLYGDTLEADAIIVKHGRHEFLVAEVIEGTLVDIPYMESDSD